MYLIIKKVKVESDKQDGHVAVIYKQSDENRHGIASGFTGSMWTTICFENDIEEGQFLLFTNKGFSTRDRQIYGMTVFNEQGIALHLMSAEDCNHSSHNYDNQHPFCLKTIPYHTLDDDMLTLHVRFVADTGLNHYQGVMICFGNLIFGTGVHVKRNRRVDGEQTHVCLSMNWKEFIETTGITMDKVLKFTFIAELSIPGNLAYIELC